MSRAAIFLRKTRVLSSFFKERFKLKSELLERRWKLRVNRVSVDSFVNYERSIKSQVLFRRNERDRHRWTLFRWTSVAPAVMHGCDYATVLRNRIAVSFFRRCFLPTGLVEACVTYPLSYATKCFTYPLSYAEMRLIINESVRPYFAAFLVFRR